MEGDSPVLPCGLFPFPICRRTGFHELHLDKKLSLLILRHHSHPVYLNSFRVRALISLVPSCMPLSRSHLTVLSLSYLISKMGEACLTGYL